MTRQTRRTVASLVLALVLTLAVLTLGPSSEGALPVVDEARAATTPAGKLAEIKVSAAGSMEGYSRDLFSHWSDAIEYG